MTSRSQIPEIKGRKSAASLICLVACFIGLVAIAADLAAPLADRRAVERIYYNHRVGEKPPFEQVLPPAALEKLLRQDLRKEAALKQTYGVEIAPALLDAEVRRINTTTRAPEMLTEIKTALGDDPARFANVFARPILVERILRERFDNDDALHAPRRRQAGQARNELLAAKTNGADYEKLLALLKQGCSNEVAVTSWQLTARPEEKGGAESPDEAEIHRRFGVGARILSSPRAGDGEERKYYFEDLPGELQRVLRAQLRRPGDVSAVIEMPGGFMLYLTRERTDTVLTVAVLSLPKRSYEQWLNSLPLSF